MKSSLNEFQITECVHLKRDQFRVHIRKQKTEELFKQKRIAHIENKQSLHITQLDSIENIEKYFYYLNEQIKISIKLKKFDQGLKVFQEALEFFKVLYEKQLELFTQYIEKSLDEHWHEFLLFIVEISSSKSELHRGYEICIQLYMFFSYVELSDRFNIVTFLNERFFKVFLETKNHNTFYHVIILCLNNLKKFLIFLTNLAQEEELAQKLIFDINIPQYLAQVNEYQCEMFTYDEIKERWLVLLSTLLQHEFEDTFELFKECIWFASQFMLDKIKPAMRVFYAFTQIPDKKKKSCAYLQQMEGVISLLMSELEKGDKFAIMTMHNIICVAQNREFKLLISKGLFDIYSKLLCNFDRDQDIIGEIISIVVHTSESNNPDIIDELVQSEFLQSCLHLNLDGLNKYVMIIESVQNIVSLLNNLSANGELSFWVNVIQNSTIGELFIQLIQSNDVILIYLQSNIQIIQIQILESLLYVINKINLRLDAITDDGKISIFDNMILSLNIDKQLEYISLEQNNEKLSIKIHDYLDRINSLL